MSHEMILEGPRLRPITDPILIIRALFRWLVEGYRLAFSTLYYAEMYKRTLKKKRLAFTETIKGGKIVISFATTSKTHFPEEVYENASTPA